MPRVEADSVGVNKGMDGQQYEQVLNTLVSVLVALLVITTSIVYMMETIDPLPLYEPPPPPPPPPTMIESWTARLAGFLKSVHSG